MQPIRVVIADDSSEFIEVARNCLADITGIEVVGCAPSGPKLLEMIRDEPADLAFVDLVMPGMNGLAAAHLLKSLDPRLKVVVMSLFDDPRLATHVGTVGADGFIAKQYFVIELPPLLHKLFGDAAPVLA
ncbi:MAG: response regulator transcription factor [Burkholderiales bacterium]